MCLSIPGKVSQIGEKIIIDYPGETREANFSIVDIKIGDYVLVSNKIVMQKLDEKEALDFLEVTNERQA